MARTKGSKDLKPRRKAVRGPGGKFQKADSVLESAAVSEVERPPLPATDFAAAIAAEMGQAPNALPEPGVCQSSEPTLTTPPAGGFDPATLTLDGLASAWTLPFWVLGWILTGLRVIPSPDPVTDVGKRRSKDLAKPSYEIYRHYAEQYLGLKPENSVHVAAGVTALNGLGIVPELTEAIVDARRKWAAQRRMEQPPQGQGRPASATT